MIRSIIAILLLLASGVIFFAYTKPTYDSLQSQIQLGTQYDQALEKATELQQLKQQLLSRYNSFNPSDLARIQKALPDSVDNIRLILDLDNMAGKYGMALQNVVVNNTSRTPDGSIGALTASGQKYDSLTLQFSTQGTYTEFKQFIADLEQSLRLADLVSLSIQPASVANQAPPTITKGGKSVQSDPVYKYDMTIRTYWLK